MTERKTSKGFKTLKTTNLTNATKKKRTGNMPKRTFNILARAQVGVNSQWDMALELRIKQRMGRPESIYVVIASTGGKWFIPVPLDQWDELCKAVKKMRKEIKHVL